MFNNTVIWDGKSLVSNQINEAKSKFVRLPGKGVTWSLIGEEVLGFGYIGEDAVADKLQLTLMGLSSAQVLEDGRVESGSITALVITNKLTAHLITYRINDDRISLDVSYGVGNLAIGSRSVVATACLSIGADANTALINSTNNHDQIDSHVF